MVRNIILYIFIYVLCVGCETTIYGTHNHECPDEGCFLELDIQDLDKELNDTLEGVKSENGNELIPGSYGVPMMNWECRYCGFKDIHCPGIL